MKIKIIIIILSTLLLISCDKGQKFQMTFEPVPEESGFRMDGYWIWCGSVIRVDSIYHMFASRWVKDKMFPENYRQNSEIVRAVSGSPLGPYTFQEVVIGERDSSFWDSNMSHNPTIHKIGDEYVLFYIGSDYSTLLHGTKNLIRRVGYAASKEITGPWVRSDKPLIDSESNNPAVLESDDKIILIYRDEKLRVFLTESDSYRGPFKMKNDNVWPYNKIEDFCLFEFNGQIHMICEDNEGGISGQERWGVHLFSDNGGLKWFPDKSVVVYNHKLAFTDNTILNCTRRERPQLLIENGEITHLVTAIFDGKDSWSQPVKLNKPIKIK